MQIPYERKTGDFDSDDYERERMEEERSSIQQCIDICTVPSDHIDKLQLSASDDLSTSISNQDMPVTGDRSRPTQTVSKDVLQTYHKGLITTKAELQERLKNINQKLHQISEQSIASEAGNQKQDLQDEVNSLKQCLAICTEAMEEATPESINLFKDVDIDDDGHQIIVSTIGDLISARRITAGKRSAQVFGHMSDESVKALLTGSQHTYASLGGRRDIGDGSASPLQSVVTEGQGDLRVPRSLQPVPLGDGGDPETARLPSPIREWKNSTQVLPEKGVFEEHESTFDKDKVSWTNESYVSEHREPGGQSWNRSLIKEHRTSTPMEQISRQVLETLELPNRACAKIVAHWNIREFVQEQYSDLNGEPPNIRHILAITGESRNAQMTTIESYVKQTWPAFPNALIDKLQFCLSSSLPIKNEEKGKFSSSSLLIMLTS